MTNKNEIANVIRNRIKGHEDAPKAQKLLMVADIIEAANEADWQESFYDVKDVNDLVSAMRIRCGRLAEKIQSEVFGM